MEEEEYCDTYIKLPTTTVSLHPVESRPPCCPAEDLFITTSVLFLLIFTLAASLAMREFKTPRETPRVHAEFLANKGGGGG